MDTRQDRIHLFLRDEGPRIPGFAQPRTTTALGKYHDFHEDIQQREWYGHSQMHPISLSASRTSSSHSTTISSSSAAFDSPSDFSSQKSTISTGLSSISSTSSGQMLDQQMYPYYLPCEFGFLGCQVRFSPHNFEYWFNHSISHFGSHPPPSRSICIFCDGEDAMFYSQGNVLEMWRRRMLHIFDHLRNLVPSETMRPDYFLLDYLRQTNLISSPDYTHINQYTERPQCDDLVPHGHETKAMRDKRTRSGQQVDDLEKERRQIRREKKDRSMRH